MRNAWKERLPGLYIPNLPEKLFISSLTKLNLEERCYSLEQFLKKVYKIQYLVNSEEFQYFGRFETKLEIYRILDDLPPQNINMLTFRIKKANPSTKSRLQPREKALLINKIEACKSFA